MKYNALMFRDFLSGIHRTALLSFRGYYILGHVLAFGITFLLVVSGFDWWFFESTRRTLLSPIVFIAGIGGFFVPVIIPIALHTIGQLRDSVRLRQTGAAAAQAVIVSWVISSFYKALTGRIEPEYSSHLDMLDRSRTFNFGFFEYGIFWGWPSSHTAVAFALASVLVVLLAHGRFGRFLAIFCASFVGIGAAIGFHWFSDVIAGAIVGILVGITIGRVFAARLSSATTPK